MDMPFAIAPGVGDQAVNCTPNSAADAGIGTVASTDGNRQANLLTLSEN